MNEREKVNMCCAYLIKQCIETNATSMKIEQKGFHKMEGEVKKELGDWEVVVRQKPKLKIIEA